MVALAGFALGFIQILQDRRRGRWAFLVNRPISLNRIFWGKVISGVLLYLPAVGLPLAGAVVWMAKPGHVTGPFDWQMMLPRLADVAGGLVCYLAALHAAARRRGGWAAG